MSEPFKIAGVTACTPGGILENACITVRDGRIASVECAGPDVSRPGEGELWALPAFLDIHCHGSGLFSLGDGMFDERTGIFDESDASFKRGASLYARLKAREGVANFYAATGSAPKERLRRAFGHLAAYMRSDANGTEGAVVHGGLLEGTFFNPNMAGAQDPALALAPSRAAFDDINESDSVRLVNIAPDTGEPAWELIEYIASRGLIPGAGHTAATADQVREAVRRGLRYIIHFTNGPTGGSYKPYDGGGTIEATLQSDELYAELICDGHHVNPAYVRDIIARKGVDRIIAVTDQTFATGTSVRRFRLGGLEGQVSDDGACVQVVGRRNTLFCSCLTMDAAFSNLLSWLTSEMPGVWNRRHEPLPLRDAIAAVARMCSTNAARMTGLYDDPERATGTIEPGKRADIVLGRLTGEPGRYCFVVDRLFVRGRRVTKGGAE